MRRPKTPTKLDLIILLLYKFDEIQISIVQGIIDQIFEMTNIRLSEEKRESDDEIRDFICIGKKYYNGRKVKKDKEDSFYIASLMDYSLRKNCEIRRKIVINFLNHYKLDIDMVIEAYKRKMMNFCIYNTICYKDNKFAICFWCKNFKFKKEGN